MVNGEESGQDMPEEQVSSEEVSVQPQENSSSESSEETHLRPPKQVFMTDVELKSLKKEAFEYKNKYLSLLADMDNTRKRLQKEKQEMTKYALANIISDFLRPIDNLENALNFAEKMSDEVKNWAIGFQMILTQFKDILSENGVVPVQAKGTQFDPHEHEAVEMVETEDFPPGTIVEECIRGYKMGDRTIRPARVKVAKAIVKETQPQEEQEQNNQL